MTNFWEDTLNYWKNYDWKHSLTVPLTVLCAIIFAVSIGLIETPNAGEYIRLYSGTAVIVSLIVAWMCWLIYVLYTFTMEFLVWNVIDIFVSIFSDKFGSKKDKP